MKRRIPKYRIELGAAIRRRRQELGLSQEQFAEVVDCHRNFVGRIERGQQNPTVDTLVRIANGLKCKVVDLIRDSRL
ncbi:helix-turn-helix domain-containing protein [Verrucomicrobiota bacterium]